MAATSMVKEAESVTGQGLKSVKSCSWRRHLLFTCSDTFAAGCIVQPQNTSERRQYGANSQ